MKIPRLIPVGRNWALVDEEDYEELKNRKWYFSGGSRNRGYATTSMRKEDGKWKTIYMHQLIMPPAEEKVTDHRNGNTLDNRRSNLRSCIKSLDRANCIHKANPDRITSSRFKGVSFKKSIKRWIARIGSGTNREWLGCFATEELAAQAYNKAARMRWANFSRLNRIDA
jgi:AP2 domain